MRCTKVTLHLGSGAVISFFLKLRHQRFPFCEWLRKGHVHVDKPLVHTLDLYYFRKKIKNVKINRLKQWQVWFKSYSSVQSYYPTKANNTNQLSELLKEGCYTWVTFHLGFGSSNLFFKKRRHQRFPFYEWLGKGHMHDNGPLVNTLDLNDFRKKNKNQLFLKRKLRRDQKRQSLRRRIKKKK